MSLNPRLVKRRSIIADDSGSCLDCFCCLCCCSCCFMHRLLWSMPKFHIHNVMSVQSPCLARSEFASSPSNTGVLRKGRHRPLRARCKTPTTASLFSRACSRFVPPEPRQTQIHTHFQNDTDSFVGHQFNMHPFPSFFFHIFCQFTA